MIEISKRVFDNLIDDESSKRTADFKISYFWKKNKLATIWYVLCMVAQIPLVILKTVLMVLCFIPHAVYDALDNWRI